MNDNRQSGRSTRAIQAAPHGATYVCPHRKSVDYHRALAQHLCRPDLIMVGPDWIREGAYRKPRAAIVIDHEARWRLTESQREILSHFNVTY